MIEDLQGDQMGFGLDGDAEPIEVSINQFYGIEINDFAVSVAKTALWIAEEQMMRPRRRSSCGSSTSCR